MRLRPINKSRRSQLAEHEDSIRWRLEAHDLKLADRHGDSVIQRLNKRLFEETLPAGMPDVPERGSLNMQGVRIFRPVTMESTVHPDDHKFFDAGELAAVIDEAKPVMVLNRQSYRHFDYIEGSEHDAMVGFQTEGQEKADRDHQKKIEDRRAKNQRRAKRAGYKLAEDMAAGLVTEEEAAEALKQGQKFADIRRDHSAEVADRINFGFYYPGGGKIAGEICGQVFEFFGKGIYRSRLGSPSLARTAALYPTVKSGLRAGYDKEALYDSTCKLFALDAPYVELNRKIAGCIIVELDSVLRIEEFRLKLLEILGPDRMPNLMVGRITAAGFLSRPHLIWILKNPVWYEHYQEWTDSKTGEIQSAGDKRCKLKPIKKYNHVQRGLTQLLLPLGADPACHNIWKPKGPLSPFWTTIIANDDIWHDLGDFEQIKGWPERVDEHALEEAAATMRADATGAMPTPSNLAWKVIGHVIEPLARLQLGVRDQDFITAGKQGVGALAAWFDQHVRPSVERELGPSDGLDRIMSRRCDFAARYCLDKLKKPRRKGRGRDRDLILASMTTKQRRKQSCDRTGEHRHDVMMCRLKEEIKVGMMVGSIDKAAFLKRIALVSKSAAYEHWDEACASLGIEFRDGAYRKKAKPTTCNNTNPAPALPARPAFQASDSTNSTLHSTGHQVQTTDPSPPDPCNQRSTAGPADQPWPNHAVGPAGACPDPVSRVLEPA